MQPTIKAILFDLDDTLFDNFYSTRCGLTAAHQTYPQLGKIPFADFEHDYHDLLEGIWHRVLSGEITMEQSRLWRFRAIFEKAGLALTEPDVQAVAQCYRDAYQEHRRVIDGVVPLLEALRSRRIKIVIVTNNMVVEQEDKLRWLKLEHLIDHLIVSEGVGIPKPAPGIFHAALMAADCQPNEAVMVGDSWHADILGAQGVGIRAVWLNRSGVACPDPSLATEITRLEPLDTILNILLSPQESSE